ncbi:acyltransferase [Rhodococcus sp. 15-2388-1-1a]|uniref:acyltransferase family protein n=1 Tax=Nocardiaceae TaxID=85025 RepID=UPI000560F4C2|nr:MULTISPECIES: acyltransferase [Rhodococcus]OZE95094.1 acyltransferase [Rhodococcus sp. 15-2388-1-1a]
MGARYWPALDGLRALSIILVLTVHTHDPMWESFNGALGVTLFFAISGFLITTLLLREEHRGGRISLSKFYIRRFFRIVPLYALALITFSLLVIGLGQGTGAGNYLERLPLLATFNGEFAGSGTFSHSWSLGIEEKFYLVWPALAFGIPLVRRFRGRAVAILAPVAAVASFVPNVGYFGIYFPIIGGCALAIAANAESTFRYVYALARPAAVYALFGCLIIVLFVDESLPLVETNRYAHTLFGLVAVLVLPGVLLSRTWIQRLLANRAVAHYGTRAYAIYLFHPLCLELVDRAIAPGTGGVLLQLARFAGVFVLSLATAEVLARLVENPAIALGRRIIERSSSSDDATGPVPTTTQTQQPLPQTGTQPPRR